MSTKKMNDLGLIYRMYGFVPYNLSPIQQGIQFGHGVVEYGNGIHDRPMPHSALYKKWARMDKTFIILNGGTTNDNLDRLGTLQQNRDILVANGVIVGEFREPDLNDALTAVVFLVDERVFNREKYPDFIEVAESEVDNDYNYDIWLRNIGGEKNAFLRTFLPKFKLA